MSKNKTSLPPIKTYTGHDGKEYQVYDLTSPRWMQSNVESMLLQAIEKDGFTRTIDAKTSRWVVLMETPEGLRDVASFDVDLFQTSINPSHAISEMMSDVRREAKKILMDQLVNG